MKRIPLVIFLLLLLSSCFDTDFNFKTVVQRNGKIDREVHINSRGANRFLPPSGPQWEVKTSETKGGQAILEDIQYHIHTTGHFDRVSQITPDFRYNVSTLVESLTEEEREVFVAEIGIPEPLDQEIGTENKIELKRKRSLFVTEYQYTETFQVRWLIPILLHDLKKEVIREQAQAIKSQPSGTAETAEKAPELLLEPSLLSEAKIEELARKKLVEEILPKIHFHSEVTLPGKIVRSNATQTRERTVIWDFRASDFQNDFAVYELKVVSRASHTGLVIVFSLALLAVALALAISRKKAEGGERSSRKS